jgi:diguanylate cyclase (GGDEF)-like protein
LVQSRDDPVDNDGMTSRGTWLCPAELDRARLLDMERRVSQALRVVFATLAVTYLALAPWVGCWPLVGLGLLFVHYQLLRRPIATSRHPEYWIVWLFLVSQAVAGATIALTGGPDSPIVPWLVIAASTLPLRFTGRGVALGFVLTAAILFAATAGVDPDGFVTRPALALMTLGVLVCVSTFSATLMRSELEHRTESIIDPLSGLLNRRALGPRLEELRQQAQATGKPLCLIACDIDEFKAINDLHGHDRGDAVIRDTASAVRAQLRSFELVYRLGGDEFLILLPGTDVAEGGNIGERLRSATERARPGGVDVTLSIGVSAVCGPAIDCDALIACADHALYQAKRRGRNRVCTSPAGPVPALPLGVARTHLAA